MLTVMGTPAEEGNGKILLIEKGAFDSVDIAVMVHPYPANLSSPLCYALLEIQVIFSTGAAAATWEEPNALDATVVTYSNVSLLRQQMLPTDLFMTNGGTSVDVE